MYFGITFSTLAVLVCVPVRDGKTGPRGGPPPLKRVAWIKPTGRIAVQETLLKVVTFSYKWGRPLQKKVIYNRTMSYQAKQILFRYRQFHLLDLDSILR